MRRVEPNTPVGIPLYGVLRRVGFFDLGLYPFVSETLMCGAQSLTETYSKSHLPFDLCLRG